MKEYLDVLDDTAFGAASEVEPKFTSHSDPSSQWTYIITAQADDLWARLEVLEWVAFCHPEMLGVPLTHFNQISSDSARPNAIASSNEHASD